MAHLGCKSKATFYNHLKRLGVQPYRKGKYRRSEIENAIVVLSLKNRLPRA